MGKVVVVYLVMRDFHETPALALESVAIEARSHVSTQSYMQVYSTYLPFATAHPGDAQTHTAHPIITTSAAQVHGIRLIGHEAIVTPR
jgi:hypothetical protein